MLQSGAAALRGANVGFADDVAYLSETGKLTALQAAVRDLRGPTRLERAAMLEQAQPFCKVFGVNSFSDRGELEALRNHLNSIRPQGSTSTAKAYLAWLCHYHGYEGGPAEQLYMTTGLFEKFGIRVRDFVGDPNEAYRANAIPKTTNVKDDAVPRSRLSREERDWEIALHRISAVRRQKADYLSLGKLRIDSVPEAVFDLPWLERLNLSGTQITHLWKPERLKKLILLDCSYSPMSALDSISECQSLTTLFCGETSISDLGPLDNLQNIETIYCGSSSVKSLEPLAKLPGLSTLHCEDTHITSLHGLEDAKSLRVLDFQDTDVSSLAPVESCISLRQLILNGCHINERSDNVWLLPALEEVIFGRGALTNVPDRVLSRDANENCLPRLLDHLKRYP